MATRMKAGGLEGLEETRKALDHYGAEFQKELHKAVNTTAQLVRSEAVRSIQKKSAGGTVYQKYNPRRTHQASAPGQPPNTDTGRLAGSVRVVVSAATAEVGTDLEYGRYLEFGTQDMGARPWLNPALESQREGWLRRLKAISDKAEKSAVKEKSGFWRRLWNRLGR